MSIPQKYLDLVGEKHILSGGIFSNKKAIEQTEFDVLDIRIGSGFVVNLTQMQRDGHSQYRHPTFELLLKNDTMPRSRWSKPMPIRELTVSDDYSTVTEITPC